MASPDLERVRAKERMHNSAMANIKPKEYISRRLEGEKRDERG
jgi:hypothetical protein